MHTHKRLFKSIAHALIVVMWGQPLLSIAAELRVDSDAGGNTQITHAQNGVPVVKIATPNGNGLSHNKFTDYNVSQQGLILNNSTDKLIRTQLGGIIFGNSQLNGQSARLILNEVTGGQASQLKGYTEVAGKRAHVVVANPHGISCDGCGFINTPHATLTTGKPIIEQGQLRRYDVEGGQIEIAGAGLNASNISQFDLITRSAKINADLHANTLNIITGRNSVDAQTLAVTAKTERSSDQPSLAIDSSALGGMYAGAIRLVGTEAGVGVKLAGDMAASAGDIQIDANGTLSLARTAASRDLQLNAQNVELNADTYAGREVSVKTPQLNVKESLAAGARINLQTGKLDNMGLIEAGVRADGRLNSAGQLELSGTTVSNRGQITSYGDMRGDIQQLDNRNGRISSGGDNQLLIGQLNNQEGQVVTQGTLAVEAGHVDNRQGVLLAQGSLSVAGETLDNSGGGTLAANAQVGVQLTGALNNNDGLLEAGTQLALVADSFNNARGQIRALGNAEQSSLVTTGLLNNNQGLIEVGNATLRLESGHLSNEGGHVRHLGKEGLQIDMNVLGQAGGHFMTNSVLHLSAQQWVNRSLLQAASMELDVERLTQTSSGGLLTAGSLNAHGENWSNDGRIEADHDLSLELTGTYQGNGSLIAQGDMDLSAGRVDLASEARLQAGGHSWLNVLGAFANQGKVTAAGWLELSTKSLENQGSLGTAGELLLVAPDIRNEDGLIFSGEDMRLLSQRIENRRGDLYSLGNLLISGDVQGEMAERLSNLSGSIEAAGNMNISAQHIENAREVFAIRNYKYSARLVHVGCTDCSGTNEDALFRLDEIERAKVINTSPQAQLLSGGAMVLRSDELDNRYSLIASGGDLQVSTGHLNNQGAQTGDVHMSRILKSHRVPAALVSYQIADANAFSARNWHGSASYRPSNINADLNSFFNQHIYRVHRTSQPVLKNTEYHHATIQAAGDLQIEANKQVNNSLIRPSFSYVAGGSRDLNTSTPGSSIATSVVLNPQLPPDLLQQAVGVPSFTLPSGSNGLFSLSNNPTHSYLIETNPLLASMRHFLSSDYLLGQLGLSTDNMQKRLGDGLYEQRLLRDAWTARTGQRFIAGIHSDEAIYRYLMDNAIASKDALSLSVGVSLTSEQVAALTHDIVWMEEREVQGEKVLVPVLYMAQAEGRLAPSGALVQGRDIALISGSGLNNQGTLRASNNLDLHADSITNSGLMQANARLQLLASDNIGNTRGGIISGGDVSLLAGQDIINERSVTTHESTIGDRYQHRRDFIGSAAQIEADSTLSVMVGRDLLNAGGTLSSGGDMQLEVGRDLVISSAETVDQQGQRDRKGYSYRTDTSQYGSQVQAGEHLQASAGRDLAVIASHVKAAGHVSLEAGGNVNIASASNESHYDAYRKSGGKTVRAQGQRITQQSSQVEAGGSLGVLAGGDLALSSSQLKAADEAYLVAGGKVQLLAEQDSDYSFFEKKKKGSFGRKSYQMNESIAATAVVTSVNAGNNLVIQSGDDLLSDGARLYADQQLILQAGKDIQLLAAQDSQSKAQVKSKKGLLSSKAKTSSQSQTSVVGGELIGHKVSVVAGRDLLVAGSDIRSEADTHLQAGRDIDLTVAKQQSSQSSSKQSSRVSLTHHGLLTHNQKKQRAEQGNVESVGSYISAESLAINSGRDARIQGSTLITEQGMHVSAGRDLRVGSAENSRHFTSSSSSKKTGGIGKWWQPAVGQVKTKIQTQGEAVQQSPSQLASLTGNIKLKAGNHYQQTASQVLAVEGDVDIQAQQITIEAGYDQLKQSEKQSASRTAIGGAVSIPVVDAVQSMQQVSQAVSRTDDSRMQALGAATLAMQSKTAYEGAKALANKDPAGVKFSVSLGSEKSKSESVQQAKNVIASSVVAGGDVRIQASGNSSSDVQLIGSTVSAGRDLSVQADRNILLLAAENTSEQSSKNSGSGWSAGIGLGIGSSQSGFTLDLAANQFQGKSNGSDSTWSNVQLEAGRQVSLESGQNTVLKGAVVKGEQVTVQVGGDLILESLQDSSTYKSKSSSASIGASLCMPPFCAGASTVSGSYNNSKVTGDYASVIEQTGIQAGDEGFQLSVKGHTDLTGAVIASSDAAVQGGLNRLETGTLAARDIENHAKAKATSAGVSLSSDMFTQGKYGIAKGIVGNGLNNGSAKDSSSGYSLSAVSEGEVLIKDEAGQLELTGQSAEKTLAQLKRDTNKTHIAAERIDAHELERNAEALRIIKQAVFAEAVKFTDESYRTMFLEEAKVYAVERDEEGKIKFDDDGNAAVRELSPDEKKNLGSDGKSVKIFNNGIFNDKEAAGKYTTQMLPGSDNQVYLIHFPEDNNAVSELLVAGYQKFMENDFWGLANATIEAKEMMKFYGETGLDIAGHSRGSMTVLNAMQSLQKEGAVSSLSETMVHFFGPAASAQTAVKLLYELSDGKQGTVYLQNHQDDFVGSNLGGNPATYDQAPEGSSKIKEWINMFNEGATVHSCYGVGKAGCESYGDAITVGVKREAP